jgi:hypothetical protein
MLGTEPLGARSSKSDTFAWLEIRTFVVHNAVVVDAGHELLGEE